jgi:cell division protein FtsW (lipid II flippase)
MIPRLFPWRMSLCRLMVRAVVLAIVVPTRRLETQQMWLVVVECILVVIAAVVVGTQVPSTRAWLRR